MMINDILLGEVLTALAELFRKRRPEDIELPSDQRAEYVRRFPLKYPILLPSVKPQRNAA